MFIIVNIVIIVGSNTLLKVELSHCHVSIGHHSLSSLLTLVPSASPRQHYHHSYHSKSWTRTRLIGPHDVDGRRVTQHTDFVTNTDRRWIEESGIKIIQSSTIQQQRPWSFLFLLSLLLLRVPAAFFRLLLLLAKERSRRKAGAFWVHTCLRYIIELNLVLYLDLLTITMIAPFIHFGKWE